MQAVRNLGVTATAFDAYMGSLVSAIRLAQDHLNLHHTHKTTNLSTTRDTDPISNWSGAMF
jgi:hypothetical protein